jgi:hypothetical protein
MVQQLPLVWFRGVGYTPGGRTQVFQPVFPVYLIAEEADRHQFVVALEESQRSLVRGGSLQVGQLEREYILAGADVTARDPIGRTALIEASYRGHVDLAAALIEAGADVNAVDGSGESAYLIATSELDEATGLALLEVALDHGADLGALDGHRGTGLIRAVHRGYPTSWRRCWRQSRRRSRQTRWPASALLEAIILGSDGPAHVEVVRRLLDAGADPNRADGSGVTPLIHARRDGQSEVVDLLVAAGAH